MRNRLIAMLAMFLLASGASAQGLTAGTARIDVTPPIGHPMWGYALRRDAPSVGVRDPLHARAAVLTVNQSAVAFVSLDLGRAPTRQSMAEIRKGIKAATGIDTLFVVATHTHHGPVLELDNWPAKEKPYVRRLEEKIVQVVSEAHKNQQPARLAIGAVEAGYNRNRHSKRPDRPVDKEMIIVRLDDLKGKPIAHLVNYAAHPTMLPATLHQFSPDFPGFFAAHVEKELGGACLLLQGAAGDLSANAPAGEGTPERFGAVLGRFVIDKSQQLKSEPFPPPARAAETKFVARERDFTFRSRVDIGNPLIYAAYSLAFFPGLVNFYEREYREGVRPHSTTALLDGRIGFVGVSGELFTSHAIHLKRRARLEHLMVFGYCNDYQQYLPTIEAVAEGGYGADTTVAPAEIGAGERIVDQALMDLLELQGKIRLPKTR